MDPIKQLIEDPGFFARRNGIFGVGKYVAHQAAHPIGETVMQVGGAASGLGKNIIGLTTVGLTAAVSAGMVQVDYYHQCSNLREMYKDELAAKLKKSPGKVTASDLETIGKSNRTIAEELRSLKKERNSGIIISFLASMASLAVIAFAMPTSPSILELFHATWKQLGTLALNIGVGLATYNAVKVPLHWLSNKLFGIDEKTTHDRIVSLQRDREAGKAVSREQVLSVFAHAHPQLDSFIAAHYGASFDKLDLADKQKAAQEIGQMVPLDQLAADINAGKINATELAFAVEGDISGVERKEPREPKKPGMLGAMWNKMRGALRFKPHPDVEAAGTLPANILKSSAPAKYDNPQAKGGHAARLGRGKMDASIGHVAQLDRQAVNSPISQTIQ